MPDTVDEKIAIEAALQVRQKAEAISKVRQRGIGSDAVSDAKARELWNKRNDAAMETIMAQGLTGWEATKALYPYRGALLDAANNRGGVKEVIRFTKMMGGGGEPASPTQPEPVEGAY